MNINHYYLVFCDKNRNIYIDATTWNHLKILVIFTCSSNADGVLCRPEIIMPDENTMVIFVWIFFICDLFSCRWNILVSTRCVFPILVAKSFSHMSMLFQQPLIVIGNSRHPCVSRTFTGDDFIPNDIRIGRSEVSQSFYFLIDSITGRKFR